MRMEYLVRSLLDAASLDAGGFSVSQKDCNVGELLHEATEMFSSTASSKSIQLESSPPGPGARVHADRERSLQVLANLLERQSVCRPAAAADPLAVTGGLVAALFTLAPPALRCSLLGR